jgi:hypothetical protein
MKKKASQPVFLKTQQALLFGYYVCLYLAISLGTETFLSRRVNLWSQLTEPPQKAQISLFFLLCGYCELPAHKID